MKFFHSKPTVKNCCHNLHKHLAQLSQISDSDTNAAATTVERSKKEMQKDSKPKTVLQQAQVNISNEFAALLHLLVGDTTHKPSEIDKTKIARKFLKAESKKFKDTLVVKCLQLMNVLTADSQTQLTQILVHIITTYKRTEKNPVKDQKLDIDFKRMQDLARIVADIFSLPADETASTTTRCMSQLLGELLKDIPKLFDLLVLNEDIIFKLLKGCDTADLIVSTSCFESLRKITLDGVPKRTGLWLTKNYDKFFKLYNQRIIQSDKHIVKLQGIRLLADIFCNPTKVNRETMFRYVGSTENLKLFLTALSDDSAKIAQEAFDVFKLFVGNPFKRPEIYNRLKCNQKQLVKFLETDFLPEKCKENKEFLLEKNSLIDDLKAMKQTPEQYKMDWQLQQAAKKHSHNVNASKSKAKG